MADLSLYISIYVAKHPQAENEIVVKSVNNMSKSYFTSSPK